MNIYEFQNTLIGISYAAGNSRLLQRFGNTHETEFFRTNMQALVYRTIPINNNQNAFMLLYLYHNLYVITLYSFNVFTIIVTPQSVLWKY